MTQRSRRQHHQRPEEENSFFFKVQRNVQGARVTVTANWIARQSLWSVQCKKNGELLDACLGDDPWKEARAMVEAAFMNEDTPLPVTATVTDVVEEMDEPPRVAA